MPKVKTEKIRFQNRDFQINYHVDSHGLFRAVLPDEVKQVLNAGCVTSGTLDDCVKEFHKALVRYEEANTKTRRIILYDVKVTAYIKDHRDHVICNDHDVSFAEGAAITVAARVVDEQEIKDGEETRFRYDEVDGIKLNDTSIAHCAKFERWAHNMRQEPQMPYTKEREQFFIKIAKAMDSVTLQLKQLSDMDKAMKIADSGRLALPEHT